MKVINLSVKRPVGTMMVYVGVLILGVISLSKLAWDLLPNLSYPKITVFTDYPGSGPGEIERFITTVLEGPLAAVPGVKEISSVSKEGISLITLEFHWGTDMNFALLHTKEQVESISKEFNREIEFQPVAMESELIISSIDSLNYSLVLGAILAIFVLLLFLQDYKDPLLISIVIPICIISTFVLMYVFNVTMNIMSLGGLVLGVGMFVDNSVIVMEVIARYKKKYKDDKTIITTAAIEGTNEVGAAITGSTLTNIAIFLPVIYLYGVTGRLFRDMALTVSFSLLSSLVVALTLLPALASYQLAYSSDSIIIDLLKLKPGVKRRLKGIGHTASLLLNPLYKKFNRFYDTATAYYQKLLEKLLDNKRTAAGLFFHKPGGPVSDIVGLPDYGSRI